jgi:hypothetical protein
MTDVCHPPLERLLNEKRSFHGVVGRHPVSLRHKIRPVLAVEEHCHDADQFAGVFQPVVDDERGAGNPGFERIDVCVIAARTRVMADGLADECPQATYSPRGGDSAKTVYSSASRISICRSAFGV